jgi:predicted nucleotidyltransferase
MKNLEEIKQKLIELKPILKEKYKVKEIGIFGSYIKGKQTKRSDLLRKNHLCTFGKLFMHIFI